MPGARWRSSPAPRALPVLRISLIPRQLPGQSWVSPPFPCLGLWGQGQPPPATPGARWDSAHPQMPSPVPCRAAKLVVPAELPAAGTAAGPSRGDEERRVAWRMDGWMDPGLCTLSRGRGCPAHRGALARGVSAPKPCQGGRFPWVLPAVVGPHRGHAPG